MECLTIPSSKLVKGKQIGRGGYGTVYSGTYAKESDGRLLRVALKVLEAQTEEFEDFSPKFHKEIQMLKQLTEECDHVCRFHGVSEFDGRYCMVMKLYAKSLEAELAEVKAAGHKLNLSVLLRRAMDICSGLHEVHDMNVEMRDLKPANVLIGENGTAVLSDFGLAKAVGTHLQTSSGHGAGTYTYMAPELLDPDEEFGAISSKVDIWALGCTIIEMGNGYVYPAGITQAKIMKRVTVQQIGPDIPEWFPTMLQDVVRRCLAIKADERPTASEVMQVLQEVDAGKIPRTVSIHADSASARSPADTEHTKPAEERPVQEVGSDATHSAAPKPAQAAEMAAELCRSVQHVAARAALQKQIRELVDLEDDSWPFELLSKMDRLGSMPPSPSRDAKYRMCIKIMGNTTMYITSEEAADVAKQLVKGSVLDYVLQNIASPPYTDDQPGMAALFLLAMEWCRHKQLHKWVVEKQGAMLLVTALERMLAVRAKGYSPATCSSPTGEVTPVSDLMDSACESLLLGLDRLVQDQEVWDKSSIRKNAVAGCGLAVLLKYAQTDNAQLRCTALRALTNVVASFHSKDHTDRVEQLRAVPGVKSVLAKLAQSSDEEPGTTEDATYLNGLLTSKLMAAVFLMPSKKP